MLVPDVTDPTGLGLRLVGNSSGLVVSGVSGVAAACKKIEIGDILLSVNSISVNGLTFDETTQLLDGPSSFLVFMRSGGDSEMVPSYQAHTRTGSIIAGSKTRTNIELSSLVEPILRDDPILNAFLEHDDIGMGTVAIQKVFGLLKQFGLPVAGRDEFDKWLLVYGLQTNERLDYLQFLKVCRELAILMIFF